MVNMRPRSRHLAHLSASASQPIVFLTVTTWNRARCLDNPAAHRLLHDLWAQSGERNGWFVGDYVLMPDHAHLFVRAAQTAMPLSDWVKLWKSMSSRQLKEERPADSALWQADYFDRFVRSGESYAEKWAYVNANPVRARLVDRPGDWPYQGRIHRLEG